MQTPVIRDVVKALEEGAHFRFGLPSKVMMPKNSYAVLNLVAAEREDPDPWITVSSPLEGIRVIRNPLRVGVSVAGMEVSTNDIGPALTAIEWGVAAATDRHDENADAMRVAAGQAAMRITDIMVRARMLDAVEGWSAVLGTTIDESDDGSLHDPAMEELTCRLIRFSCPSTGRSYVLRVPSSMKTAREARLWTLQVDETPQVET